MFTKNEWDLIWKAVSLRAEAAEENKDISEYDLKEYKAWSKLLDKIEDMYNRKD